MDMVGIGTFSTEEASVFTAPEEPRLVRINGGWFGDLYLSIGKPIEDIYIPDIVSDEHSYREAKAVLAQLESFTSQVTDSDDLEELNFMIEDLRDEIRTYEEDFEPDED